MTAETRARAADIVGRLREQAQTVFDKEPYPLGPGDGDTLLEAAAEIERLRAVAEYWRTRAKVAEVRAAEADDPNAERRAFLLAVKDAP